ncbi:unnamed protein product, partial [Didymodactylos carnosus]
KQQIPYVKLGYNTLKDLLVSMNDIVHIDPLTQVLHGIPDENTKHIKEMIQQTQNQSKHSKRKKTNTKKHQQPNQLNSNMNRFDSIPVWPCYNFGYDQQGTIYHPPPLNKLPPPLLSLRVQNQPKQKKQVINDTKVLTDVKISKKEKPTIKIDKEKLETSEMANTDNSSTKSSLKNLIKNDEQSEKSGSWTSVLSINEKDTLITDFESAISTTSTAITVSLSLVDIVQKKLKWSVEELSKTDDLNRIQSLCDVVKKLTETVEILAKFEK